MFDIRKFGKHLASLRRDAGMTQRELGDRLNVTRQAVSRYERGGCFPDISVLMMLADIFGVSLDSLIRSVGSLSEHEPVPITENPTPPIKHGILEKLKQSLAAEGIDISHVLSLADYLNGDDTSHSNECSGPEEIGEKLLERLIPFLDPASKEAVFQRILSGDLHHRFVRVLLPHAEHLISQIEAAVMEGVLPDEALEMVREYQST